MYSLKLWKYLYLSKIEICQNDLANTRSKANVDLMWAHHLRCWPNIEPTLGELLVFAGEWFIHWELFQTNNEIPYGLEQVCKRNLVLAAQQLLLLFTCWSVYSEFEKYR